MTTENNEVVVATDKPLISEDTENEENELVCSEKCPKSEINENSTPASNDGDHEEPRKAKTASASLSGGGGKVTDQTNQSEHTMAKSQSEIQVSVTNSLSVSQTSKNSLMTFSSSGTFYDHATAKKKVDLRITPKRVQHSNGKDATDFRQMEQGLLQLLEDFHSGKLEAFGQDCTFQRMENVREQQERLARLHFDLNVQQERCGQHTEEGIKMAKRNLAKLTENLQELSHSIEKLQSGSLATQADV